MNRPSLVSRSQTSFSTTCQISVSPIRTFIGRTHPRLPQHDGQGQEVLLDQGALQQERRHHPIKLLREHMEVHRCGEARVLFQPKFDNCSFWDSAQGLTPCALFQKDSVNVDRVVDRSFIYHRRSAVFRSAFCLSSISSLPHELMFAKYTAFCFSFEREYAIFLTLKLSFETEALSSFNNKV